MSVYLNIAQDNDEAFGTRRGELYYMPAVALPEPQRKIFARYTDTPLEAWTQAFDQLNQDVALSISVKGSNNTIRCAAAFVEEKENDDVIVQFPKPSAGYLTREFSKTRQGYLHGAQVNSPQARQSGFTNQVMRAFHEADLQEKTETVTISATGAGNYVWMAFGAVPRYRQEFARNARTQWQLLQDFTRKLRLPLSPELMPWVHGLATCDDASIRKPFDIAADPVMRASLKALLTGDAGFTLDPNHRYSTYPVPASVYAQPMNVTFKMDPQDADLQRHLLRRTGALSL